jgi:hypothetical protein
MEPNAEELKFVAQQPEVLKEEAAVEAVGILEDRYGDWHLAEDCRRNEPRSKVGP